MTTNRPRGIRRSKFFRLCSRAPLMCIWVTASMVANPKRIQMPAGANAFGHILGLVGLAFAAAAACAAAARGAAPAQPIGLRDGETLTYSVRWGFIPFVGRIKIAADSLGSGSSAVLRITTTTWTSGLPSGLLVSTSEWSAYRNKQVKNSVAFDYGRSEATYTDAIRPSKTRKIPMPNGIPNDLILALI